MPKPECEMCGDPFERVVICSECSDAIAVDQVRLVLEAAIDSINVQLAEHGFDIRFDAATYLPK